MAIALNHLAMGRKYLRGRRISVGRVTRTTGCISSSLSGHDIGYVRGICRGDGDGSYVINLAGDKLTLPRAVSNGAQL